MLDFDGVVTKNKFRDLYNLCIKRGNVHICSANPLITPDWFVSKGLEIPKNIHSMKGKKAKIKRLVELSRRFDVLLYVDNETEYLDVAWVLGINTYHYQNGKINFYTKNTR